MRRRSVLAVGLSAFGHVVAFACLALLSPVHTQGPIRVAFHARPVPGSGEAHVEEPNASAGPPPRLPPASARRPGTARAGPARATDLEEMASAPAVGELTQAAAVGEALPVDAGATGEVGAGGDGSAQAGGRPGGGGGAGGPTVAAAVDAEAVRASIQAKVRYPRAAKRLGVVGTVLIRFRIDDRGGVHEAAVLESAGPLLDAAAMDALRLAPPLSSAAGWVRVPVVFSLGGAP